MQRVKVFRHAEGGGEHRGWVCMALFGVFGEGPTRQAAWDVMCARLAEPIAVPVTVEDKS